MPTIAGELETRTEEASECPDLADFSCGDGRLAAESTVEGIVAAHRENKRPNAVLRVTREKSTSALVGLTVIETNVVKLKGLTPEESAGAAYIAVISLSEAYRGGYKTEDGTPLGRYLLGDALRHIEETTDRADMPLVQAIIEPENMPSRRLFEGHGFLNLNTDPHLLHVRPPGIPLEGAAAGDTIENDEEEATAPEE